MVAATIQKWNGDAQKKQPPVDGPPWPGSNTPWSGFDISQFVRVLQADGSPAINEPVRFTVSRVSGATPDGTCAWITAWNTGFAPSGTSTVTVNTNSDGICYPLGTALNAFNLNPYPQVAVQNYQVLAEVVSNTAINTTFTCSVVDATSGVLGSVGTPRNNQAPYVTNANTQINPGWQAQLYSTSGTTVGDGFPCTCDLVGAPAGTVFTSSGSTSISGLTGTSGVFPVGSLTIGSVAGSFKLDWYETGNPSGPHGYTYVTVLNPQPTTLTIVSGTPQSARANTLFAAPLVVLAKDASGTASVGYPITFTSPSSGASCGFSGLTTYVATSDASGTATAPKPLANSTQGSYLVTASSPGCTPVTFSLTNTAPTIVMEKWNGDKQTTENNLSRPTDVNFWRGCRIGQQVRVLQANGTPWANTEVKYDVTSQPFPSPNPGLHWVTGFSGQLTSSMSVFTNSDGIADDRLTITPFYPGGGDTVGTNLAVRATLIADPVVVTDFLVNIATVSAGVLAAVGVGVGTIIQLTTNTPQTNAQWFGIFYNTQDTLNGYAATAELVGAPAGTIITQSGGSTYNGITSGSGSLLVGITTGATPGAFTCDFYQQGNPTGPRGSMRFNVVNTTSPAVLVPISGDGQSSPITLTFPSPLTVRADNGVGTPMPGFNVTFTAPASGASCTFGGSNVQTVATIAGGLATTVTPVANGTMGTYSVVVTSSGCVPINMTLTNSSAATYVAPPPLHFCAH